MSGRSGSPWALGGALLLVGVLAGCDERSVELGPGDVVDTGLTLRDDVPEGAELSSCEQAARDFLVSDLPELVAFEAETRDPVFADCAEARIQAAFDALADDEGFANGALWNVECRSTRCRAVLCVYSGYDFNWEGFQSQRLGWPCVASLLGGSDIFPDSGYVEVEVWRCSGDDVPLASPAEACTAAP